jgi:hypothetical protein
MEKVLGYIKPAASFHTLKEWQTIAKRMLALQKQGIDTRGGFLNNHPELHSIIDQYFSYQFYTEEPRYELLTKKNVLDFVEDFINHRLWSLDEEYGSYFKNIWDLKFSYFYSRGDMEPYVMLDETYTSQIYGTTNNVMQLKHYTSMEGVERIERAIESGNVFDISAFTMAERPFFRAESNLVVDFIGNVRAGFKSDVKSYVVDNGRKACNLYRLGYPSDTENNICYELDSCQSAVETSLWNEYIATPIKILKVSRV